MKAFFFIVFITMFSVSGFAQGKVNWSFYAKKIADKKYEVHLRASMNPEWHIYAMKQPSNSIVTPTTITFSKNPLIVLTGSPQEKGKLERDKSENLGLEFFLYKGTVEFIQTISLKGNVKTNIQGEIHYQVCTDYMCMPPADQSFSVGLE